MTTTLPSNYDPKINTKDILKQWQLAGVGSPEKQVKTQNLLQSQQSAPSYTIIAPPPNLTGDLHAGHAFEHYFMDTLARRARQQSHKTLYYPGVDHAGLQLEGVINKLINQGEFDQIIKNKAPEILGLPVDDRANELKKQNSNLWLELAWSKVETWRNNQLEQAKILGEVPDFERLLFTLDPKAVKMVEYAFETYYQDGLIYKDKYLINWSVGLQTALSDVPEDIGHIERVDPLITFEYRLDTIHDPQMLLDVDQKNVLHDQLAFIRVATVRPETIFGDVAVAMHPSILASRLNNEFLREVIANKQVELIFNIKALGVENILLIIDERVDPNFGTGCLKITPNHDIFDYEIANSHKLRNPGSVIAKSGKLTELAGKYAGQNVEEARINVMRGLIENKYVPRKAEFQNLEVDVTEEFDEQAFAKVDYNSKCLILQKFYSDYQVDWNYKHNVTICERSKTIVEPLISEEFFVDYHKQFNHQPIKNFGAVDWMNTKIISERLELRPLEECDAQAIFEGMTPVDAELVISPVYETINQAQEWIESRRHEINNKTRLTLAIINQCTSELSGQSNNESSSNCIGYTGVRFEDNQYKLTIWLIDKYKGKGLAKEALRGLIKWCWQNLSTTELVWEAKEHNLKSIKLANRLGFGDVEIKQYPATDRFGNVIRQNYCISKLSKPETTLQQLTLSGITKIKFHPIEYQERGQKYFENIKNWCISRDLIWGHKMPIWYNLDTNPNCNFYSFETLKQNPELEKDFQISQNQPATPGNWVQEKKILDTWFSSTLWCLSTLDYPEFVKNQNPKTLWQNITNLAKNNQSNTDFEQFYPTQMMTSAWEIFYAWILRMIMTGVYFTGEVPFENYVCHAWILDEKGRKMSKSLGNGLDPIDQINKFSSDTLRLAMLSGMNPGKNMRFGGRIADELCEKYRNFGNKLWNIARFLELKGAFETKDEFNELAPATVWILNEFRVLCLRLENNCGTYDLAKSVSEIYTFVWDNLADWYVEYLKTDESQLAISNKLFKELIVTLHPYLPFETQSLWNNLYPDGGELSFVSQDLQWLCELIKTNDKQSKVDEFEDVIQLIKDVRSIKGLFGLDPVLPINIKTSSETLLKYSQYLKLLAKVHLEITPNLDTYQISNKSFTISIDILSYIKDKEAEIVRTHKIIENLQKQALSLESQLANQKFIENAESSVITEKRLDLDNRQSEIQEQKTKLEILR